jgi:hypothetical protein
MECDKSPNGQHKWSDYEWGSIAGNADSRKYCRWCGMGRQVIYTDTSAADNGPIVIVWPPPKTGATEA